MKRTAPVILSALTAVLTLVATAPASNAANAAPAADRITASPAAHPTTAGRTVADPSADEDQTMGGGASTIAAPPSGTVAATVGPKATVNVSGGNMFDTCDTPSLASMTAWMASPYRTVGIYVGGSVRACKTQKNLTPSWVTSVTGMGWSLVPIYVGLQAPCTKYTQVISLNQSTAASQGRSAALDAIVQMKSLGIGQHVPVYYDMENYDSTNGPCSASVKAFTNAWTATLHSQRWMSGLYGSASSMIHHAQAWTAAGGYAAPDKIWFARWNGIADANEPELPDTAWAGNRIHQFAGGHMETWGGVTINIDSNYVQTFSTAPSFVTALTPRIIWDSKTARVGTKPVALGVAGAAGIPTNASAVVLNVQIASPTGPGNLIVEPYRGTSNLATQQFAKGQYVSTTVVVPVSQKVIQFHTTSSMTRLIVSATGYLSTVGTSGVEAVAPHILWDSKTASVGTAPKGLALRGVGGIPTDATAAVLNVQVVSPSASGQLLVEPHGERTNVGAQQLTRGRSISATVVVPLHTAAVQFRLSAGKARVIVSVLGYFSPSAQGRLTSTSATLVWDTRSAKVRRTPVGFAVAGKNEIPANATAALLNVEVVNPAASGQLIVEPYGYRSNAGVQQFVKGQSISTTVLVPLKNKVAQVRVSAGTARVIITSLGYVTPQAAPPVQPLDAGASTDGGSTDGGGTN